MRTETLIHILSVSVRKNGEIPLTNKHFLNIMKMCERMEAVEDEALSNEHDVICGNGAWEQMP